MHFSPLIKALRPRCRPQPTASACDHVGHSTNAKTQVCPSVWRDCGCLSGGHPNGWLGGHATLHVMGLKRPEWWRRETRTLNAAQKNIGWATRKTFEVIELRARIKTGREQLATQQRELGRAKAELGTTRALIADAEEDSRSELEVRRIALERRNEELGAEVHGLEKELNELTSELKVVAFDLEELRPILNEWSTLLLARESTRNARRLVWATWALVLSTVTLAAPTLRSAWAAVAAHLPW